MAKRVWLGVALSAICSGPTMAFPTMCGMIADRGFACEEHNVTTDDGYILQMFRIPGTGSPALLQHGLLDSSFTWCLNDRNQSLAYILADAGMDVWLGNNRGNEFGLNHVTLSSDKLAFWQFTYDEMGMYDMPAMVDKVLNTTGRETLSYVGHSQGTMQAWIAFSMNVKDIQRKVSTMYALAAVADIYHSQSPLINLIAPLAPPVLIALSELNHGVFLPSKSVLNWLAPDFCELLSYGCDVLIYTMTGPNKDVDATRISRYVEVSPSGTSTRNMHHFAHNKNHRGFTSFEKGHGAYDLTKITVPTVIVSGTDDVLADPRDVSWLVSQLPTTTLKQFAVVDGYAHLDFTWGSHANEKVYIPYIVEDLMDRGLLHGTE